MISEIPEIFDKNYLAFSTNEDLYEVAFLDLFFEVFGIFIF